jgi:hypothetical protein
MVDSYRKANAEERIIYGKTIGAADVWNNVLSPAL